VVLLKSAEHVDEALTEGHQLLFVSGARYPSPATHERVEVGGEGDSSEARLTVWFQDNAAQVVLIEVTVGEAHRLAPVPTHDLECRGVVVSIQKARLAADQLRMSPRSTDLSEIPHLLFHLTQGVGTIDPNFVGVS
jgi:hypothetical protein